MLWIAVLSALGGLLLLALGGELLVRGAVGLARRLGLSNLLIALTVVAFATSMPELVVTVAAALSDKPDLGLGNIVGSNITNSLLIVGAAGLIAALPPAAGLSRRDAPSLLGVTLLFLLLAFFTAPLAWPQGLLLLGLMGVYLVGCYRQECRVPDGDAVNEVAELSEEAPARLDAALGLTALGCAALAFGAQLLVDGSIDLARAAGISDAAIGLTLVAFGTSLPELATSITAALRRHPDVVLGNVIGSNLFNLLAIGGVLCLPGKVPIAAEFRRFDLWVLAGCTVVLVLLLRRGRPIGRVASLLLILAYAGFLWAQFGDEARLAAAVAGH
ncbi:cation:H+ antiporter [Tistlia consotensis]|uniref:Cation:H+ antiporter n=1 Tax=Tistlia consotensis USBA 355 TaxID=560819 RepID=A0A1Y6CF31_9PROT|nr:calcium/sodium antiporter [Tistlia consotensis]SMF60958.1 cation:H+ antiporter [Tistlia consotensis USBA 355]SNR92344.1 cation:H+ antiporter [Tistlia consotensis]